MEILFLNKRGTTKLCMKVSVDDIWSMKEHEVLKLNEILSLNPEYKWKPVRTGFAYDKKLPLIGA